MTKKIFALLASALLVAGAWETIAQTDQNQRRKAFQASKQMQSLGDFADAVEVLQPLADAGDDLALYSIGILYATGGEDLKQDYPDRKSTRLNSSHIPLSRMPSSA